MVLWRIGASLGRFRLMPVILFIITMTVALTDFHWKVNSVLLGRGERALYKLL